MIHKPIWVFRLNSFYFKTFKPSTFQAKQCIIFYKRFKLKKVNYDLDARCKYRGVR